MNPTALPENKPLFFNNREQCDMLFGPCACGATHNIGDLVDRIVKMRESAVKTIAVYAEKLDQTQQHRDSLIKEVARLRKCQNPTAS